MCTREAFFFVDDLCTREAEFDRMGSLLQMLDYASLSTTKKRQMEKEVCWAMSYSSSSDDDRVVIFGLAY